MSRQSDQTPPRCVGLGFVPGEARHGFLIHIPAGSSKSACVTISEERDVQLLEDAKFEPRGLNDPCLRVMIDRTRWQALAPGFWDEATRRLRRNGLSAVKLQKTYAGPIPVHASLGKELCVLCWAVEEALPDEIPNALLNWEALAPEERWWLYTMTVATTGQALQKGLGWRKALRAALADNPFVKGEGIPPRQRRELLNHDQLYLSL